ncbi:MAG: hypothetical protein ACRDYF_06355, partial [Acidimicrobiia bacterium]
ARAAYRRWRLRKGGGGFVMRHLAYESGWLLETMKGIGFGELELRAVRLRLMLYTLAPNDA